MGSIMGSPMISITPRRWTSLALFALAIAGTVALGQEEAVQVIDEKGESGQLDQRLDCALSGDCPETTDPDIEAKPDPWWDQFNQWVDQPEPGPDVEICPFPDPEILLKQPGGQKKLDRVINGLERSLSRRATSPPGKGDAAQTEARLKRMEAELRKLNELAKKKTPNDPKVLSRSAQQALRENRFDQARAESKAALLNGAKDAKTYSTYGTASYHLKDYATASHAASLALQADPASQEALALTRLSHERMGGVQLPAAGATPKADAEDAGPSPILRDSAQAEPPAGGEPTPEERARALTAQAGSAYSIGDYTNALALATQSTQLDPAKPQPWNLRAYAAIKLRRFPDAESAATVALGLSPGNAQSLQARSWAFSRQKKYREGLADAEQALERDPYNGFQYQNKAYAQAGLGDRRGALDSLRKSAEQDPQFSSRFEAALQAPLSSDLLFLFEGGGSGRVQPPWKRAVSRPIKSVVLRALAAFGLAFLALGLWKLYTRSEDEEAAPA